MACVPSEDSDQSGHPPSLIRVFAVRMKKAWVLSYPLSAQGKLWSDWADAQADLSLRWVHSHFIGFVMRRLKSFLTRNIMPIFYLHHLICLYSIKEPDHVRTVGPYRYILIWSGPYAYRLEKKKSFFWGSWSMYATGNVQSRRASLTLQVTRCVHTSMKIRKINSSHIYAPNFKEFDGAYWFRVVRASVHQVPCMLGFWNFIYGFLMEKIFDTVQVISLSGVMPLWKHPNEIWCMPYLMNRAC